MKQSRDRRSKLDRHDFTGIFLGYTASDNNIRYLDMESGMVKESHHAVFDEAWYMQPHQPPAAQLLYDIGLEAEDCMVSEVGQETSLEQAVYPLFLHKMDSKLAWNVPIRSLQLPLPLRCTAQPHPRTAAAACTVIPSIDEDDDSLPLRCRRAKVIASEIASGYQVDWSCMEMIYMSPSPYHDAFDKVIDIRCFDLAKHPTAGLSLLEKNGQLILAHMSPSTPWAKLPRWRTRLRGLG